MATTSVKSLLGQPIITLDAGKRVGTIQELLYDTTEHQVCGVVVSRPPGASSARVVAIDHIALFGRDVTLIDSESAIHEASLSAQMPNRRLATSIIRTQVIDTEGRRLGELADIELDEKGKATGYQLAQNIIKDALRGRARVPVGRVRAIGPDAILVEPAGPEPRADKDFDEQEAQEPNDAPSQEGA